MLFHPPASGLFFQRASYSENRFALFGMQLVSHAHLSSENRFALFGMQFVSTRILFRKPLRTFRDAVGFNAHLVPKTASHFSGCSWFLTRILVPKTASHFSGCAIISPSDDSLFKKVPIS
nr:hypothetical protein TR92_08975 [Brucella anthropi]